MNFAQMEYFLAIARSGKFCQAAENAYVSQSSLSKQIKSLEEELGVELFVRSSSGATLTLAGETFLEFAARTFEEYKSVLLRLEHYSQGANLRVRIGALPLLTAYHLHKDLSGFQVDNLGIQIDLYEREQSNLIRRLDLNQVDLAIMRTDLLSPEEYDWVPLFRDEVVVLCSAQHRLTRAQRVPIEDLKDERFLLLDKQSATYQLFVDECHKAGFIPNVVFTHARHEPLLAAVQRDLGISALPLGLTHVEDEDSLVRRPLQQPIYTDVGLVFPRTRMLTPSAERFVEYFRKAYPQPAAQADEDTAAPDE